jgi:hypothetical protein
MEITYLLYLASVGLPSGYIAMALRPVEAPQSMEIGSLLTEAQQAEFQKRLDAYRLTHTIDEHGPTWSNGLHSEEQLQSIVYDRPSTRVTI